MRRVEMPVFPDVPLEEQLRNLLQQHKEFVKTRYDGHNRHTEEIPKDIQVGRNERRRWRRRLYHMARETYHNFTHDNKGRFRRSF